MTAIRALHEVLPRRVTAAVPSWIGTRTALAEQRLFTDPEVLTGPSEDLAAELEQIRSNAAREGLEAGKATVVQVVSRYLDGIERLEQTTREAARPFSDAPEIAILIAKEILGRELSVDPDSIVRQLSEALTAVGSARPIRVRMGPTDLEYVLRKRPDLLSGDLELIEDDSLGIGGCVVEGPQKIVDSSIETRLLAMRAALEDLFNPTASEAAAELLSTATAAAAVEAAPEC